MTLKRDSSQRVFGSRVASALLPRPHLNPLLTESTCLAFAVAERRRRAMFIEADPAKHISPVGGDMFPVPG